MEDYQHLANLLLDIVFLVRENGEIAFVNGACLAILGYAPSEMVGRSIREFVHPDDLVLTNIEMVHVANGRPGYGFENRYLHKNGEVVHLQWSAHWSEPKQLRVGVARDVSKRKHKEEQQAALLALSTSAQHCDSLNTLFTAFNTILQKLIPLDHFEVWLEPSNCPVYQTTESAIFEPDATVEVPMSVSRKPLGKLRLQLNTPGALSAEDSDVLRFVANQAAAVIERLALQSELAHAARHDALTGLPNRRLLQDRIESAIARSRREPRKGAVLFIDLNDFKRVNDQYGHGMGDQLLQEIAKRIVASVRETDTVARFGGDEFVALLEDVETWDHAQTVVDKIHTAIERTVEIDGTQLQISASIGFSLYPLQGKSIDQLMRSADKAMYANKAIHKEKSYGGSSS